MLPSDCRQRRELLEAEAARLEAELKAARLTARVLRASAWHDERLWMIADNQGARVTGPTRIASFRP